MVRGLAWEVIRSMAFSFLTSVSSSSRFSRICGVMLSTSRALRRRCERLFVGFERGVPLLLLFVEPPLGQKLVALLGPGFQRKHRAEQHGGQHDRRQAIEKIHISAHSRPLESAS